MNKQNKIESFAMGGFMLWKEQESAIYSLSVKRQDSGGPMYVMYASECMMK